MGNTNKSHIAILKKKYIDLILTGVKSVESRITKSACAPFNQIDVGDTIFLKISSGPFVAKTHAIQIEQHQNLNPDQIMQLYHRLDADVCGGIDYWQSKTPCQFATFIWLSDLIPITTGPDYPKSMKAWHVLHGSTHQSQSPSPKALNRLTGLNRGPTISHTPNTSTHPHSSFPASPDDFTITLTPGALKNGYIRIPPLLLRQSYTPNTSPTSLNLILPNADQITTEIIPRRNMIRWRGWPQLFQSHNLTPGDEVRFVSLGNGRYRVLFVKQS
ncbi:hypothetical protein KS4_21330 [Poriferisphaera corsica]|uniref:TF-B3 domain-containing protein n=1 Tax=Poriferisphaera corsica TaxID=2528020 RepID=A0A517YV15_9BACT|nr:hypothetical protein [Poriferisphaera corsica]QDU34071.1 hypothetical protein KS4_21330 [Poriferisphaera corsica]